MQFAVFNPFHAGHLRHFAMHFKALGLEFLRACAGQLQGQLPGEKTQTLSLGLKGFVQAFLAIFLYRLADSAGGQWVQCLKRHDQFRVVTEKAIKCFLMSGAGFGHN